jgi:hypothetical protein
MRMQRLSSMCYTNITLRDIIVCLEAEVEAARVFFTSLTRTPWLRVGNAVPEAPSATPVSIMQSLSALRL